MSVRFSEREVRGLERVECWCCYLYLFMYLLVSKNILVCEKLDKNNVKISSRATYLSISCFHQFELKIKRSGSRQKHNMIFVIYQITREPFFQTWALMDARFGRILDFKSFSFGRILKLILHLRQIAVSRQPI